MAFWGNDYKNSEFADPKRKFRFLVQIGGINENVGGTDGTISTSDMWFAKTCTRPAFTIATAEHKYLNHTFYYPGSVTWEPITITFADPQDPNTALLFSKLLNDDAGYKVPDSSGQLSTMSKAKAVSALGGVQIKTLNADGEIIEQWDLYNSFITDIKYGDLAYGDDELVEMSISLRYDWAKIEQTAEGGGNQAYFDGK
jgi:hypothetical protein